MKTEVGVKMTRAWVLAGSVVAAMLFGGAAYAAVLTFDGDICDGGGTCSQWDPIDQTYGDIPGQLDVTYLHRTGQSDAPVDGAFLKWWDTDYSDLENVAFAGFADALGVSEIALIPAPGFTVTLNSFDLGAFRSNRTTQFVVWVDSLFSPGLASGPFQVDSQVHTHVPVGLSSSAGLFLQWGPDGHNVGIDNIDFTLTGGPPSHPVPEPMPEPMTGLLLAAGGVVTGMFRLRKTPRNQD